MVPPQLLFGEPIVRRTAGQIVRAVRGTRSLTLRLRQGFGGQATLSHKERAFTISDSSEFNVAGFARRAIARRRSEDGISLSKGERERVRARQNLHESVSEH
jgi:hypothetical protein